MSKIFKDSYFIKLTDKENYFLHDHTNGEWIPKEGYSNAHIWKKTVAERIIRALKKKGIKNLEAISVEKAAQADNNQNNTNNAEAEDNQV